MLRRLFHFLFGSCFHRREENEPLVGPGSEDYPRSDSVQVDMNPVGLSSPRNE